MRENELKDSVQPNNPNAEEATRGAILLDWDALSDTVTNLKSDRFYNYYNRTIYEAMVSLFKQNVHGDYVSITNELTKTGKLEQAGGPAYIASLTDKVPTSANIKYYVDTVMDCATRRDLIKLSAEIKASCFDSSHDSKHILEEAEKKSFNLADRNDTTEVHHMQDVISSTIGLIEKRYNNNSELTGIPSGIARLDTMTSGFQKSELIIVGARPSIGKTAFALSMMQTIAIEKNIPCGFFSLEMSCQSIGQRLLSQVARIPSIKLRNGMLNISDFKKLQDAAGKCYNAPLYIIDTPNMQLLDIRATARRLVMNQQVQAIFIDYIGLISVDKPSENTWENISEISKSLKALARELDIPIIVLCQVGRDAEGQEPNLAQLRGSGSIEQDADVVMFLHRDRKIMDEANPVQDAKCVVAKQRNGATGDIEMLFFPSFTKFENKVQEE